MRVLVFGVTRKTRRRTFQYYQNRASAPARRRIQRADLQSAIKHPTFKIELFRKWPFVRYRTNQLEHDHFTGVARTPLLCSDARGMATALCNSVTIELNEIFKISCVSVCWISRPRKGASNASAAVYARSADRQEFRWGQTDRWPESPCH